MASTLCIFLVLLVVYHSQQPPKQYYEETILYSLTLLCALATWKHPLINHNRNSHKNNIQLQKCHKPIIYFLLTPFTHWFKLLEEQFSWGENFMNGSCCIDLAKLRKSFLNSCQFLLKKYSDSNKPFEYWSCIYKSHLFITIKKLHSRNLLGQSINLMYTNTEQRLNLTT